MITKTPMYMMILAMDIIGYRTAYGHHLRSRCDCQHPSAWNHQPLNITQENTGLTDQTAALLIKSDEMIHFFRIPKRSSRIQTNIAITAPHTISQTGKRAIQHYAPRMFRIV